jgi:hypothetical protein
LITNPVTPPSSHRHPVSRIALVQTYKTHLAETVQDAAEALSLRTIRRSQVENVLVEEIKVEGL